MVTHYFAVDGHIRATAKLNQAATAGTTETISAPIFGECCQAANGSLDALREGLDAGVSAEEMTY